MKLTLYYESWTAPRGSHTSGTAHLTCDAAVLKSIFRFCEPGDDLTIDIETLDWGCIRHPGKPPPEPEGEVWSP